VTAGTEVATLETLLANQSDPDRLVLIRGAAILSMDPSVGDLVGDLLIRGKVIEAVGPSIEAPAAAVIDAAGKILVPGFCDPHIHSWQGQIPRLIANPDSDPADDQRNYFSVYHRTFAPAYRPEDMYVGTLVTMLSALNGGITTVCDNSHNSRSPDHSDAAVQALLDAGIRGVHASGPPTFGQWDQQWPSDVHRLRETFFASDDQLVTLRLHPRAAFPGDHPDVLRVRRDLDLWMSFDAGQLLPLEALYASGDFDGRESYNHGTGFTEAQRRAVVDHGAKVNIAPRIDTQFGTDGLLEGFPSTQQWLDAGLRPAISGDDPATYSIDMFTEMRVLYAFQRSMANYARHRGDPTPPAPITLQDVLDMATLRGAEGCALNQRVGSLSPGKRADLVVVDTDDISLFPVHNAYATLVQGATPAQVDTVLVDGAVRKWRGRLVAVDLGSLKERVLRSRDHLFREAGWQGPTVDFSA